MSRLLGWLFLATLSVILLLQLRGIDAPLVTDVSPWGIVSYELAFTLSRATAILDTWRIAGVTESARVSLGVDVGFLLVYPWFLRRSVQLLRELRWSGAGALDRVGARLAVVVLACLPLDAAENWTLWRMIETGPSGPMALLAGIAASIKFLLVLATIMWCLVVISRRVAGPSSRPTHG